MLEGGDAEPIAVTGGRFNIRWSYRWTVVAFTTWTQALTMGASFYSFNFWVVPWSHDFGVPTSQLMGIISAFLVTFGLLLPLCGAAADKFRFRPLYFTGLMLFALSLYLVSLTSSYWVVLLSYAFPLSIGLIICGPLGSQVLVSRWFADNRGVAFGISGLGVALGGVVFPFIVTGLMAQFGWRLSFRVLAVGTVVLLAPIAWVILSQEPPLPAQPSGHRAGPKMWRTLDILRLPDFWILSATLTAVTTAYLPLQHSIRAFAQDNNFPPSEAAFAASLSAGAFAISALILGRLADRLPHRYLLRALLVLVATGVAMVGTAQAFPQYVTGLFIVSFATGGIQPLMSTIIVGRFGTKAFGQVYGLIAGPFAQLALLAPYFCGLIREATGSYSVAYLALLVPVPFTLAATFFLSEKRSNQPAEAIG